MTLPPCLIIYEVLSHLLQCNVVLHYKQVVFKLLIIYYVSFLYNCLTILHIKFRCLKCWQFYSFMVLVFAFEGASVV